MDVQTAYQQAIKYAAQKHGSQTVPGTALPYLVHLSNVAMEVLTAAQHSNPFDLPFAVQVALLHDILEDTPTTHEELAHTFYQKVADAVAALTKNDALPKMDKMQDSLSRILQQPKEVWAVKLADRITNLQAPPPHWNFYRKTEYLNEATIILDTLQGGNAYLEERLARKIAAYEAYL
jgi:guanosine-3',5'-bis(diphosphate) 3'-pyrophosphohydrolase